MTVTRRYPRPKALPEPLPEHLILDASAGTGKTYALEHIILDLILPRQGRPAPLQIQQILVSTYTEKAAGEMRERIRTLIGHLLGMGFKEAQPGEPCWEIDLEARAALERARLHFDRATITTIHAFCQNLLRETAFLTGEPFQSEVVDGEAFFRRTIHDCIRRVWAVKDAPKAQAIRQTLDAFKREEAFCAFLRQVKGAPGRRHPDPRDPAPHHARFQALYDPKALEAHLKGLGLSASSFTSLRKNLDAVRDCAAFQDLTPILERLLLGKTGGSAALLAAAQNSGPDQTLELLQALTDLMDAMDSDESRAVEDFLADALAHGEAVKAEEGLLEFDDMAPRVARALASPATGPALVKLLRSRYKVVLLDEFQDTSPDQWQVFHGLFGEDTRLFLIGDPKQAIYGFRGGDVHAYMKAQNELGRRPGSAQLPLTHNYRSTPRMIEAYNLIMDQNATPPFFTGGIQYTLPVAAGKPGLRWVDPADPAGNLPPIRLVPVAMEKGPSAEHQLAAIARQLALQVRALLRLRPQFRDDEKVEPLEPADIFVLTRKGSESAMMHKALWELGVPAAYYKRDHVFQAPEAADLLSVLQAIEDPADASRRARAFLTPVFGVPLAELRNAQQLPDAHPFMEQLRGWHQLARQGKFGELFRQMLDEGLVRRLIRQEQDDQAASVWAQLTDHMLEATLASKGNFAAAVAQLEDCIQGRAQPPGENSTKYRAASDQSAVQILTMHAAKGLEAKVVVVFGGFTGRLADPVNRFALGQETRHWIGTDPSPMLKQRFDQENREEAQRLLYVALTRAQAQLILPVYVLDAAHPAAPQATADADPRGDYADLNRRLRTLLADGLGVPPQDGLFTLAPFPAGAEPPPPAPTLPIPAPPDAAFWQTVPPPPRVASLTSLTHELRMAGREDPEFSPGPVDRQGIPGGPQAGSCMHAVLERAPLASAAGPVPFGDWKDLPEVADALLASFRESGFDAEDQIRIAGLAFRALKATFPLPDGRGAITLPELRDFAREMPFLMQRPGTRDYLDGSIDLLFEVAGRTYFVDWKSNALPEYGAATCAIQVQDHYALQFAIYALAVCRFLGIAEEADFEARFGGGLYVFVRGLPEAGLCACRPTWDELRAWAQLLQEGREEEIHVRF